MLTCIFLLRMFEITLVSRWQGSHHLDGFLLAILVRDKIVNRQILLKHILALVRHKLVKLMECYTGFGRLIAVAL